MATPVSGYDACLLISGSAIHFYTFNLIKFKLVKMPFMVEERKLVKVGNSYYVLIPLEISKEIKDEKLAVVSDLDSKAALIFPKSKSGREILSTFTEENLMKFLSINLEDIPLRKLVVM